MFLIFEALIINRPPRDFVGFSLEVLGIEDVAWNGRYRATWNPDAIGYPCAIAMVETVKEVQQLVTYAAKHCYSEMGRGIFRQSGPVLPVISRVKSLPL